MRLHSSTRGAVAAALLGCSLASAQSTDGAAEQLPGFDLERLETNVGRGTLLVGNGELMVPEGLSISLLGHYQALPLVLNDGLQDLAVVRHRATGLLAASYGLLPWLEVGALVPFVLWQQGDDPQQLGLAPLTAQGLGTPVLQARLGLMSRRHRQPVDLSADLGVGLPVGTAPALAGDEGPRFHARMTVGTVLGSVHPSLEAGVLFRPAILLASPDDGAQSGALSEVRLGAAVATTGKGLRGEVGLRATLTPETSHVSMELLGGVRFPLLVGLEAFVQGGPGIGNALGTPRFRALVGVAFRSEPPPKLSFIDEHADRELQLALAEPKVATRDDRVRPVGTWELNSLTRADPSGVSGGEPKERLRPYQPAPEERIALRGQLTFSQDSAELPGVVPLLDQAALRLQELAAEGSAIIIEGHADTEGQEASDVVVALRRAQAVRRYLIDQGIPPNQLRIRSFGSDWPVSAKPSTQAERQLNRRVEVLVITKKQEPLTTQSPLP